VKRLPDEDCVYGCVGDRNLLRRPETDCHLGQQVGQLRAHAVVWFDGEDCRRGYSTPQQRLSELASARSQIEHPRGVW
jgi:hypothetical protein